MVVSNLTYRTEYSTNFSVASPPGPKLDLDETDKPTADDLDQRLFARGNSGVAGHLGLQPAVVIVQLSGYTDSAGLRVE